MRSRLGSATGSDRSTGPGVDPSLAMPLYHQLFLLLRERIRNGEYRAGSFLPGEPDLARGFGVSRVTAKRALDDIAAAGLAVREQGRGTRVRPLPSTSPGNTVVRGGVDGLAGGRRAGVRNSVALLEFDYLPAEGAIAETLALPVGTEVQRSVRISSSGGRPLSHLTTFVPGTIGRNWTRQDLQTSPLVLLLEDSGIEIARAEDRLTAALAEPVVAACLAVAPGAALLKLVRIVFDRHDRPVEWLIALYPPDRYEYHVSLSDHRATVPGHLLRPD